MLPDNVVENKNIKLVTLSVGVTKKEAYLLINNAPLARTISVSRCSACMQGMSDKEKCQYRLQQHSARVRYLSIPARCSHAFVTAASHSVCITPVVVERLSSKTWESFLHPSTVEWSFDDGGRKATRWNNSDNSGCLRNFTDFGQRNLKKDSYFCHVSQHLIGFFRRKDQIKHFLSQLRYNAGLISLRNGQQFNCV